MSPSAQPASAGLSSPGRRAFDYTTVGHVTADVMSDGSRQAGGSALYSALQASRLGRRARIITQGAVAEIEELLAPFAGELEVEIRPAARTTTLQTDGSGGARRQRLLAWAGPIEEPVIADSAIVHIAPVARESPWEYRGAEGFVGLTPQGLVREWAAPGGEIVLMSPSAAPIAGAPRRCDAIVLNEYERPVCAGLLSSARAGGAIVAVTDEGSPTRIMLPAGGELQSAVPPLAGPVEDVGAGDVFAAAFFLALYDGHRPSDAASFASAAAAVRMLGTGAGAIGDLAAVEKRLALS
jgi:hypothetical protein